MIEPLFDASGVSLTLGGHQILSNVSLSVHEGEIVTIVGPNGSGKSSLLRLIIGAVKPTGGKVLKRPGLVIGYVPQKLFIDHTLPLTVGGFLSLIDADETRRRAIVEQVGISGLEDRQVIDLSGGQMQRVLLAQAILRRPSLLVLDEASQGLDQHGVARFYQLVEQVRREQGCGVLMVSHDLHVVMSSSDRVICLNGHICCEGTPTVVSEAPEYRALFGMGTEGALALYKHHHDHSHGEEPCAHTHDNAGGEH